MRTPDQHFNRAALGDYLRRVESYPELDRERELELARCHLDGDARAGDLVVCAHLRDVVAIARRYRGYGQPLGELIAAGNLGLVRALRGFDPERGLRFMTYASYWVRAEILDHIVDRWSAVGVGKSSLQRRLFFGLRRARARLEAGGLGGAALEQALADHFDCSCARIRAVLARLDQRDTPVDALGERLVDVREVGDPEAEAVAGQLRARLDAGLAVLDPRERLIVEHRFLSEGKRSRVELGAELGISRERVRQLEQRALDKLRDQIAGEPAR